MTWSKGRIGTVARHWAAVGQDEARESLGQTLSSREEQDSQVQDLEEDADSGAETRAEVGGCPITVGWVSQARVASVPSPATISIPPPFRLLDFLQWRAKTTR